MTAGRGVFKADHDTVSEILDFIDQRLKGFPEKAAYNIRLACEEILVNIASYAYPQGDGRLAVVWENDTSARRLTVRFEDSGVPFDPLAKEDPDLDVPVKERKIGGLGIMMVRRLMDTVDYVYADGKNILTLTSKY